MNAEELVPGSLVVLRTEALGLRVGDVEIVVDVSFEILRGELF
jgi:hypothetical protein